MIKNILIGILLIGILAFIGFSVFMARFDMFGEPTKTELKTECDYEGLRKVILTKIDGNATTNPSIHVYATDCNYDENQALESIFVVDAPNIKPSDVSFEWKNFDTLTIIYKEKLRVFKQESESKTLNPEIIFEYIAE